MVKETHSESGSIDAVIRIVLSVSNGRLLSICLIRLAYSLRRSVVSEGETRKKKNIIHGNF